METSKQRKDQQMQYTIKPTYIGTKTGREVKAWDVVDTRDGYVYDTFSLKRDAQHWINQAIAANQADKK
jgi:hypothetical protein